MIVFGIFHYTLIKPAQKLDYTWNIILNIVIFCLKNLAEAEANLFFFVFYNKRIECYWNCCTCLIQLEANLNIVHLYTLKRIFMCQYA